MLIGCGTSIQGGEIDGWGDRIVSTVGQLPVVDARSVTEWQAGHIPDAAQVHWTELTGADDDGLWGVLEVETIAGLLSDRGVSSEAPLVVYGSGPAGYGDDGNVYWTLRYLGHEQVSVLNGGWPGWLAAGNEPSLLSDAPAPADFTPRLDASLLATTEQVAAFDGVLLDVRSEEEWLAGHIPGAIWMEWTAVYDGALTLHDEDTLRALFQDLGITLETPVIVYCAGGIRAGHTFMVLEALGHTSVRNYVGSWARWTAEGGAVEYPQL
jgi:thiosulfate/3-mercaptopyruvate sulfurtransferase